MHEEELWSAVLQGQAEKVEEIMRLHPAVDVNWKNPNYFMGTPLYASCDVRITRRLLLHPRIDLNSMNSLGSSAFLRACSDGRVEVVQLFLHDARLDLDQACADNERTGMWKAARWGQIDVVKCIIACGREFSLEKTGRWLGGVFTAAEIALLEGNFKIAALLQRYRHEPDVTRWEVQVELRFPRALAAELFAHVVFVCDDLLEILPAGEAPPGAGAAAAAVAAVAVTGVSGGGKLYGLEHLELNEARQKAKRFFEVARRLPMELQMILCHQVYESARQSVTSRMCDLAFRMLARRLLQSRMPSPPTLLGW